MTVHFAVLLFLGLVPGLLSYSITGHTGNEAEIEEVKRGSTIPTGAVGSCGQAAAGARASRIVGGKVVTPGDYPWVVALGYGKAKNKSFIEQQCGATLISKEWVLTATHCFTKELDNGTYVWDNDPSDWIIRLGEHSLSTYSPTEVQQHPSKIVLHSGYRLDDKNVSHDIALLKLTTPLTDDQLKSSAIGIACLEPAGKSKFGPGTSCIVCGWGAVVENGSASDVLKVVDIPILGDVGCDQAGTFCAGHLDGGKDSCQGDSGGGFLCQDKDGRYYVRGVVSHGDGCARKDSPATYTDVSYYLPWIQDTVQNN